MSEIETPGPPCSWLVISINQAFSRNILEPLGLSPCEGWKTVLTNLNLFVTDENGNYLFPIIRILSQGCSSRMVSSTGLITQCNALLGIVIIYDIIVIYWK